MDPGGGLPAVGARVGLGVGFQPVPGAQIVRPAAGDDVARIPARPDAPVHAVVAGIVLDVDGLGGVVLRSADGTGYRYAGLDPGSLRVGPGATVDAGDILGAVGADGLEMRISDPEGYPLDAVDALLGLADPNELGYAPVGSGSGIDPDAMDREIIAAGLPGPGGTLA